MQRTEAEHVLRAAAAIAQEQSFVVVGSQAVLRQRIDALDAQRHPPQPLHAWLARRVARSLSTDNP